MKLQFNIGQFGSDGSITGWNQTSSTPGSAGIKIAVGNVDDSFGNEAVGISFELIQIGVSGVANGISTGWDNGNGGYLIVNGPDAGQRIIDLDGDGNEWPNNNITTSSWFTNTSTDLEVRINGLAAGVYNVSVYAGARDNGTVRDGLVTVTGDGAAPFSGTLQQSPLLDDITERTLTGAVTVDGSGQLLVKTESTAGRAATLSAIIVELIPSGGIALTGPLTFNLTSDLTSDLTG